jgi:hypothetical protein
MGADSRFSSLATGVRRTRRAMRATLRLDNL